MEVAGALRKRATSKAVDSHRGYATRPGAAQLQVAYGAGKAL